MNVTVLDRKPDRWRRVTAGCVAGPGRAAENQAHRQGLADKTSAGRRWLRADDGAAEPDPGSA